MTSQKQFEAASEDAVQCYLFPISTGAEDLQSLCQSINNLIHNLSNEYIWHHNEFKVYVPVHNPNNHDLPIHLISTTSFGDNIEDEWFIVYLVLEITKLFQDIVVQIFDNDGEFLLIESADLLPSWANPDTTENRVFIYRNGVHLIPTSLLDLDSETKVSDAIKLVTDHPEETVSPGIYQAIQHRICGYPKKIIENIHKATVKIPIDLATLLTLKPSLISPITSAYCNHDVIDAKLCKKLVYENCVTTTVKFTKCLYAMLIHSKLPKTVNVRINENDKKTDLGLKLTCGYEMIMKNFLEDPFSSKEFDKFIKSLTDNGYFKDNLEGSKDYKKLLENAKEFFLNMESKVNLQVCNSIHQLMNTEEFIKLKNNLKNNPTLEENLIEDNDDWLNIDPEQLNNLLQTRYGKQSKFTNKDILDPQKITSELSNFLKETSDFEGIETKEDNDSEDENIEFDSEQFISSLQNMMKLITNNNEVMDSDDDFSEDDENVVEDEDLDLELKSKLIINETQSNEPTFHNILQSLKEEEGSSGPSSNLLKTLGIDKTDLINIGSDVK